MVAFCDSVGARKIQDFVLGQVFGHYYCTDVQGSLNFLAHILDFMWLHFC